MEIEEKYKIVQELWDKHMFISESSKTESAMDETIPFSAHDTKNIRTWKYKYKPDEVSVYYNRVSHVFQWADEVLEEWGYECIEKNKILNRRGFLDNYYSWGSPNILYLDTIIVHSNFCHKKLFKFYSTGYDSCYFKVEKKEDIQTRLEEHISFMINKNKDKYGSTDLVRQLKLKKILKEEI